MVSTDEAETDILLHEERGSPPPVPPPIAAPLLEMGFPLKHITNAINVTKSSGEVSAHTINILASWMLEHPYTETNEGETSTGLTRSESTSAALSKVTRSSPVQEVSSLMIYFISFLNCLLFISLRMMRVGWTLRESVGGCLGHDDAPVPIFAIT